VTILRPALLEFAEKVLGLLPVDAINTPAFDLEFSEKVDDVDNINRARILGYALTTWQGYAAAIKRFLEFCKARELSPFECTPSVFNLYLLKEAKTQKTVSFFQKFLDAWSFTARFFLCNDVTKDQAVQDIKRFVEKACPRKINKKYPFGVDEVRQLWDAIDSKRGGVNNLDQKELRSFMIAVFQHQTFCRFSDLKNIKLEDVFYDLDYFKIHVKYSKTDQGGKGQWLYLPKLSSDYRDPHALMCLYIHHLELDVHVPSPYMYLFPPLE
jgi:integrase